MDDEPALLEIVRLYLELSGQFTVETLTSAASALGKLKTWDYDAIISDYQMPEMDGIAFLKAVREQHGDIPFILFTGRGREEIVIQAINFGVDFYLQKGGDPKAQFAELAHKVRQAVARRRAELSLIESEKRLADLINFLPDATFAIDRSGKVIAWNRAIEEMTGISASDILGKGDFEYAIPFYGIRRKILIDLIFESEEVIAKSYSHIIHEKDILIADTTLPRPKGRLVTLMGTASPLYDRQGAIVGAIESIRDITELKKTEEELRAANEQLAASDEELRCQIEELAKSEQQVRESELRLRYMLGFYEMARQPEKELLSYAVEGAGSVTGSSLGYVAFLNDEETELMMYAWSQTAMQECSMREKPIIYPVEKTGLWGEAVRQRRPVITNDYQAPNPGKKGYPQGHPHITRHMNVPIMDGGNIVMVAGVANKPSDYSDNDVRQLTVLMQGLWHVLQRRRAEDELRAANEQLAASDEELRGQYEELAQSEKRIRESEGKYRELAEMLPQIVFEMDTDLRITYANQYAQRAFGLKPGFLERGVNALSCIDPAQHQRARTSIGNLLHGIEDTNPEYTAIRMDGTPFPAMIYTAPVFHEGVLSGFRGVVIDITDRKNTEEALQESEERFKTLFEKSAEAQMLIDGTGKITDCNDAFLALFALKDKEEIRGYSPEYFAPEFQPDGVSSSVRADEIFRTVMEEGQAHYEWAHQKHDAARTHILTETILTRIHIAGQQMIHASIRDITDRKKIEEHLQESEEKYRSLVDLAPDAVIVDRDGVIVFANRECIRLSGADSADDLIGKSIMPFIHPDDRQTALEHFSQMSAYGRTIPLHEQRLIRVDGQPFLAEITAKPILYEGRPSVISIFRDITERKRVEYALRESEATLASIFRAAPVGIGLVSNRVILKVNDRICEMTGYTGEELVGKSARVLYPSDEDFEYVGREKYEQIRKYGTGTVETRWQRKDGEIRQILISSTPLDPADHAKGVTFTALDITERRRVEDALRESEAKFRAIIDQSFEFIGLMILDGTLIEANRAALQFAGISASAVMNRPFWETPWWSHSADLQERLKDAIRRAASGETVRFEATHPAADGHLAYIDFSIKPVEDSTGKILYLIPEGRDITERKNAEEALRESEEKYRTVVEQSQDGIFIAQEGLLVFHNTAFVTLTGYQSDELDRRSIADLIAPEDRELVLTRHRERLKGETPPDVYEFSVLHHDGKSRIPVKMIIAPATFCGKPATLGTLHNVMEDRERERVLRESEERYRSVIEKIHEGFVRADIEGRIVMASPSAARILGYTTADEMIGMPMDAIYLFQEDRRVLLDQIRKYNAVDEYEVEFKRKDGSTFWGSLDAHLLFYENGEASGTEAVIRDITERKNMENAIREANRKLNLLNSITRHDVANQLTILQGFIQVAEMHNPDPVLAEYLSRMEDTASSISHQIEFTRTYQELGINAPAWFKIGEIVENTRLPQVMLSDTCSRFEVFADPMLERVFFNLFDNAVRHGGQVTRIVVRCEPSAGGLAIVVEDNGRGIPDDEKEKIFLRGYGKNKGFGLFLVREILAITGISIRETGVPGVGARFEILVPEGMFRIVPQNTPGSQG
ncbi:MAG: PAS domain S-box protein [Methanolinea sp.]|nr:PAS domain S-box protein [Methanolinea sp.]